MPKISKFTLDNGLRVLLYPNPRSPFIATHLLFRAGAKYERVLGSGLAHLLEHLMFSGTKAVPHYDKLLQSAGASNNAYTSNDLSAYFTEVPAGNIDTILFVESDRMRNLTLNKEAFVTQKKVVIEEFKEHYLTRPYGDLWHLLSALCHAKHPYRYPVIGKDVNLVRKIELEELRAFYSLHYQPQHAILAIAGNFAIPAMKKKVAHYFASLRNTESASLPEIAANPPSTAAKFQRVYRAVPSNRLVRVYKAAARANTAYYPAAMLTEVLGGGKSSLLREELVEKRAWCSKCYANLIALEDESLLMIDATLSPNVSYKQVEELLEACMLRLRTQPIASKTLQKVKNNIYSEFITQGMDMPEVAEDMAYYEFLGLEYSLSQEFKKYNVIGTQEIQQCAAQILQADNSSTLQYRCKKSKAEPETPELAG